jgi:hypothetical protein
MHRIQSHRGDLKRWLETHNPQQNNVLAILPCELQNKSLRGDIAISPFTDCSGEYSHRLLEAENQRLWGLVDDLKALPRPRHR